MIVMCIFSPQDWEFAHNRLPYTTLCFTIQFLVPSIVVCFIYIRYGVFWVYQCHNL